jgi:hypothetical protein
MKLTSVIIQPISPDTHCIKLDPSMARPDSEVSAAYLNPPNEDECEPLSVAFNTDLNSWVVYGQDNLPVLITVQQ